MTKELLIQHFWILYFAVLGIGAEELLDKLDILASQIEANFVKNVLESHETPPYFLMN